MRYVHVDEEEAFSYSRHGGIDMFYYLSRGEGGPCVAAFRRRRRIQHGIDLREGVDLRGSKRGVCMRYYVAGGEREGRESGRVKGGTRTSFQSDIHTPAASRSYRSR